MYQMKVVDFLMRLRLCVFNLFGLFFSAPPEKSAGKFKCTARGRGEEGSASQNFKQG